MGKTTMLANFIKEKKSVFHLTTSTKSTQILEDLALDFSYLLKRVKPNFSQFQDVIDFLDASSKTERLIVIFDKFPLLATAIEDSMGKLQRYIDFHQDNANLKIVLCGSSLSFMKTQIDDKASPLYGRKTAQIDLKAFSLSQIAQLTNRSKLEDLIKIFSVTGGIANLQIKITVL